MKPQTVNREDLLFRLQAVQPGIASKLLIEQSTSYIFRDGYIVTFNDEVACKISSKLDKDFKCAVAAKPLESTLAKLQEDEVVLEIEDNLLVIRGNAKRRIRIRMESEILLPIEAVENPKAWFELEPSFSEAVEITAACASKNDPRFAMNFIHITPKFLEACDNAQFARYYIDTGFEVDCILKRDSLGSVSQFGMTAFAETEHWLHFRNPKGLYMACRVHNHKYPSMDKMVDIKGEPTILPGGLEQATEMASIFTEDAVDGDKRVKATLGMDRLVLDGVGAYGDYHDEKEIKYRGPEMNFVISPKVLIAISKKYRDCEIAPERLKVNSGKFIYVALLKAPKSPNGQRQEPAKEKED